MRKNVARALSAIVIALGLLGLTLAPAAAEVICVQNGALGLADLNGDGIVTVGELQALASAAAGTDAGNQLNAMIANIPGNVSGIQYQGCSGGGGSSGGGDTGGGSSGGGDTGGGSGSQGGGDAGSGSGSGNQGGGDTGGGSGTGSQNGGGTGGGSGSQGGTGTQDGGAGTQGGGEGGVGSDGSAGSPVLRPGEQGASGPLVFSPAAPIMTNADGDPLFIFLLPAVGQGDGTQLEDAAPVPVLTGAALATGLAGCWALKGRAGLLDLVERSRR